MDWKGCTRPPGKTKLWQNENVLARVMFLHWDATDAQMAKSWRAHWVNLRTRWEYPPEILKAIDTTNAMESLNSVIRCATKRRK